ncbi:hypothetical protein B0G84_2376 [Paraburkholderia sp. BL8N3]|nr:DUF1643 domain-containing protein [Paraburkholderia sp. BL8N3]TCK44028.1 hypothetical protein B0G84_2376 [Paraburkholderia sp. BL8N3]
MNAILSLCGQYRYSLSRPGGLMTAGGPSAMFLMLNPSTADATLDDPTIRRCRSFAAAWGMNGITVANLYALRCTDPAGLWIHADPIGPKNDDHLYELAVTHGRVVCAWGAKARADRVAAVVRLLRDAGATLACLGTTKSGAPRHPLYVRGNQPLIEWTEPATETA